MRKEKTIVYLQRTYRPYVCYDYIPLPFLIAVLPVQLLCALPEEHFIVVLQPLHLPRFASMDEIRIQSIEVCHK